MKTLSPKEQALASEILEKVNNHPELRKDFFDWLNTTQDLRVDLSESKGTDEPSEALSEKDFQAHVTLKFATVLKSCLARKEKDYSAFVEQNITHVHEISKITAKPLSAENAAFQDKTLQALWDMRLSWNTLSPILQNAVNRKDDTRTSTLDRLSSYLAHTQKHLKTYEDSIASNGRPFSKKIQRASLHIALLEGLTREARKLAQPEGFIPDLIARYAQESTDGRAHSVKFFTGNFTILTYDLKGFAFAQKFFTALLEKEAYAENLANEISRRTSNQPIKEEIKWLLKLLSEITTQTILQEAAKYDVLQTETFIHFLQNKKLLLQSLSKAKEKSFEYNDYYEAYVTQKFSLSFIEDLQEPTSPDQLDRAMEHLSKLRIGKIGHFPKSEPFWEKVFDALFEQRFLHSEQDFRKELEQARITQGSTFSMLSYVEEKLESRVKKTFALFSTYCTQMGYEQTDINNVSRYPSHRLLVAELKRFPFFCLLQMKNGIQPPDILMQQICTSYTDYIQEFKLDHVDLLVVPFLIQDFIAWAYEFEKAHQTNFTSRFFSGLLENEIYLQSFKKEIECQATNPLLQNEITWILSVLSPKPLKKEKTWLSKITSALKKNGEEKKAIEVQPINQFHRTIQTIVDESSLKPNLPNAAFISLSSMPFTWGAQTESASGSESKLDHDAELPIRSYVSTQGILDTSKQYADLETKAFVDFLENQYPLLTEEILELDNPDHLDDIHFQIYVTAHLAFHLRTCLQQSASEEKLAESFSFSDSLSKNKAKPLSADNMVFQKKVIDTLSHIQLSNAFAQFRKALHASKNHTAEAFADDTLPSYLLNTKGLFASYHERIGLPPKKATHFGMLYAHQPIAIFSLHIALLSAYDKVLHDEPLNKHTMSAILSGYKNIIVGFQLENVDHVVDFLVQDFMPLAYSCKHKINITENFLKNLLTASPYLEGFKQAIQLLQSKESPKKKIPWLPWVLECLSHLWADPIHVSDTHQSSQPLLPALKKDEVTQTDPLETQDIMEAKIEEKIPSTTLCAQKTLAAETIVHPTPKKEKIDPPHKPFAKQNHTKKQSITSTHDNTTPRYTFLKEKPQSMVSSTSNAAPPHSKPTPKQEPEAKDLNRHKQAPESKPIVKPVSQDPAPVQSATPAHVAPTKKAAKNHHEEKKDSDKKDIKEKKTLAAETIVDPTRKKEKIKTPHKPSAKQNRTKKASITSTHDDTTPRYTLLKEKPQPLVSSTPNAALPPSKPTPNKEPETKDLNRRKQAPESKPIVKPVSQNPAPVQSATPAHVAPTKKAAKNHHEEKKDSDKKDIKQKKWVEKPKPEKKPVVPDMPIGDEKEPPTDREQDKASFMSADQFFPRSADEKADNSDPITTELTAYPVVDNRKVTQDPFECTSDYSQGIRIDCIKLNPVICSSPDGLWIACEQLFFWKYPIKFSRESILLLQKWQQDGTLMGALLIFSGLMGTNLLDNCRNPAIFQIRLQSLPIDNLLLYYWQWFQEANFEFSDPPQQLQNLDAVSYLILESIRTPKALTATTRVYLQSNPVLFEKAFRLFEQKYIKHNIKGEALWLIEQLNNPIRQNTPIDIVHSLVPLCARSQPESISPLRDLHRNNNMASSSQPSKLHASKRR